MSRFRPVGSPSPDDGLDWFWSADNPRGCGWGLCPDNRARREHPHPARGFAWCDDEDCTMERQHAHVQREHPPYIPKGDEE